MRLFFAIILLLCFGNIHAGDTLTLMHYNLLNYGNPTNFCSTATHNIDSKAACLKTIVQHIQPDIMSVNEIACEEAIAQHILDHALNSEEITYYRSAEISCNSPYNTLANALFYNSQKLSYYSHISLPTAVRDINIYKLYYKAKDLADGDTVFIHCIIMHLKAGNEAGDIAERETETTILMNYLNNTPLKNAILCGDLNMYSSSEAGFQNLSFPANTAIQFFDPVNQSGDWHENANYASVHTQSTHNTSGCFSGGGMDDRFDFILISADIKNGNREIQYISNSYKTTGQDGRHFDKSLLDAPQNTTVSAEVLNALYNMSDHLPLSLELAINKSVNKSVDKNLSVQAVNPFQDYIQLHIQSKEVLEEITIEVFDVLGIKVLPDKKFYAISDETVKIPSGVLQAGLYIVRVTDIRYGSVSKKIVKY